MSVYVDDMKAGFGRMVMCHMIADTHYELLAMANVIGVAHKWIQKSGEAGEHFDICLSKRKLAVTAGAKEISQRELGMKIRYRRQPEGGRDLALRSAKVGIPPLIHSNSESKPPATRRKGRSERKTDNGSTS